MADPLVLAALAGFASLAAAAGLRSRRTAQILFWAQLARELGLSLESRGILRRLRVRGMHGATEVIVERRMRPPPAPASWIEATLIAPMPAGLSLQRRTTLHLGTRPTLTRDPLFDAGVDAFGEEVLVLAALSGNARGVVALAAQSYEIELSRGRLVGRLRGPWLKPERVVSMVKNLLAVTEALSFSGTEERLLESLRLDPHPAVRTRILELLLERHGGSPLELSALETAIADADPSIRVQAAPRLADRPRAQAVLQAVIEQPQAPGKVRGQALAALCKLAPGAESSATARRALDSPDDALASSAAELLEGQLTAGDEASLVGLLLRPGVSARTVCARQLGHVGTVAAVPSLAEVARGLLVPGELKAAARRAIAAIQDRAGAAGHGQLSVVDRDATTGALSVDTAGGALSDPRRAAEDPPPE